MKVTILPGAIKGETYAIASKSHLHRLLICAALSDAPTLVRCQTSAEDITATVGCLSALGAKIEKREDGFAVTPIDRNRLPAQCVLPCGESGSTLRFMLPIVSALGVSGRFEMSGRLPERPLAPLDEELCRGGIRLWRPDPTSLCCEGKLVPGDYSVRGDVSSQYITGLLLALPLLGGKSSLSVIPPIESEDYIAMTLEVMEQFSLNPPVRDNRYEITGQGLISPGKATAQGDWSNAAFWLCAGATPGGDIRISGLDRHSSQGDREICEILARMGANVSWGEDGSLSVSEGNRRGVEIDARATPDLIPVLCAVAAVGQGTTTIKNAARLRLKESDRITATAQTLNALGAKITEREDGLIVEGVARLSGGEVDSWGDHRIAMMAGVASAACDGPVVITGAQAVNKSYPGFWQKLAALGKEVTIDE